MVHRDLRGNPKAGEKPREQSFTMYSGYITEDVTTLLRVYQPRRALGVCYYAHSYGVAHTLSLTRSHATSIHLSTHNASHQQCFALSVFILINCMGYLQM